MPDPIKLSDDDRSNLKEIMEAVGLTQKGLAQTSGVEQPWLSQTLSGRRRSVDGEMLGKVAYQLAVKLRKGVANFGEHRNRIALAFLSRFSSSVEASLPKRVDDPGDPLPTDAPYFVKRHEDQSIFNHLQKPQFAILVAGPVQCGKTSLLKGLESRARAIGIETAWLDPVLPMGCSDKDVPEINAATASHFAQELKTAWGLDLPRGGLPQSISDFLNWLPVAIAPTASKPRLLIIDDLSAIGPIANDRWVTDFLRVFWNNKATLKHVVNLAVGSTYYFNQHFSSLLLRSSMVNWDLKFQPMPLKPYLKWFSAAEVGQLCASLTGNSTDWKASPEELYQFFKGQPYLTHSAALDKHFYNAVKAWLSNKQDLRTAKAVRSCKSYLKHLKAIKQAVLGPSLAMDRFSRELLVAFARCKNAKPGNAISEGDGKVFLQSSMLIDEPSDDSPEESSSFKIPLYRLIAEDLDPEQSSTRGSKIRSNE